MSPGWSKSFSPETINLLDYVEMDPQTIPNGNKYGETLRIWNFDTYVDDPEEVHGDIHDSQPGGHQQQ